MTPPEAMPGKKRVLIVDDHPMTREGIALWISHEPDLDVCYEAENAEEGFEVVMAQKPDLVLTDITLPGKSGIEFIKDVQAVHPELPILVISMHDESLYAERALRAGARGYIMKHEGGSKVVQAIRRVLSGQIYVSEKMSARILELFSTKNPRERAGIEQLSDREFEVFELLGKGLSTHDIGKRLHLSAKTVDAHRANIKEKLNIRTTPELISFAASWAAHEATGGA